MIRNNTASKTATKHDVTATMPNYHESETLKGANSFRAGDAGTLAMNRDLEGCSQRLTDYVERELFQVELCRFAKIGQGLFYRLALGRGAGLRVQGGKASLRSRHKDSCK